MPNLSESYCNVRSWLAIPAITGISGTLGALAGVLLTTSEKYLLANIAIGASVGSALVITPTLAFVAYRVIYDSCKSPSDSAVDIENQQEETKLVPAKNNAQAPRMYGMFPPSEVADTGSDKISVQISGQDQTVGPGIFPASNLQPQ